MLSVCLALTACGGGGSTGPAPNGGETGTPPVNANAVYLKTSGAQLLDGGGKPVLLRGVNVPVFKSGYVNDLPQVIDAVKSSKANAVRIVWWSNPPNGTDQFTLSNFENAISTVTDAGMLPIVELHDATCFLALLVGSCNDTAIFNTRITQFWTRADVMAILKKYQGYLVVNLANEWGRLPSENADASAFVSHYAQVLQTVRSAWSSAGISPLPIMLDAPNGGSYSGAFLSTHASGVSNGRFLINSDPQKNLIFSTHAYWPTSEGHTEASVTQRLQGLANSGLPFVLGEVGRNANGSCGATDEVPWRTVMTQAAQLNLGTLGWAWYEESCPAMNLTVNRDGVTLPANDGTDDFSHRMLYDPAFGLVSAAPIGTYGQTVEYPMTATVDWRLCDGGQALAQGTDWVSNSNCQRGAVTYTGLAEAKGFLDRLRITEGFNNRWNYIDGGQPVKDGYLLQTAQCYRALITLQSVGGGIRRDQLYVRAPVGSQSHVLELTGGSDKSLNVLFQKSISPGVYSCN